MFLEKLLILLQTKNIKKLILFFIFFLCSCSNFDFVYKNSETSSDLSIAEIFVTGSGDDLIKKILSNKFLSNKESVDYKLSVNSKMETKSVVIENDQTASTVEIKYIMGYSLFDYKKDCIVVKESISSLSTYNSRAESYNFGSDLSKEQVTQQVIQDNINKFAYQINTKGNNLECIDES
tara:strand:- start:120 stop:656 length:537 start_codon:yes stop_codon:yes gene_type:complete